MKNFALVITALALCSVSFAQIPGFPNAQQSADFTQAESQIPDSATSCAFTFTSGKNNTFLKYCVSGNGNILSVETPQGHPQMSADKREGYGICDSFSNVNYTDFGGGGDSGNWGPAKVVSHSATSVKIARTTSDGIWTVTQTINQVSGNTPNVKITMALKNNSPDQRFAVLSRYANVDADRNPLNELDATINSAFAYNSFLSEDGGGPYGLMLQTEGNTPFVAGGFVLSASTPADPCSFVAGPTKQLLTSTDGAIMQLYGTVFNKGQSKTVILAYRGM